MAHLVTRQAQPVRSRRRLTRIRAAAVATAVGLPGIAAHAADTYTLNADGPSGGGAITYNWNGASWTGGPNAFPGAGPALDDAAVVNFREFNNTDVPNNDPAPTVDLGAATFTIGSLTFTESGTGNTDGNFANGTLNLASLTYSSGGREIDFETNFTLNGNGPSSSLLIHSAGNNIDILGKITSTTNLTFTNTGTQFMRLSRAIGTTPQNDGLASLTQGATAAFVVQHFDTNTAGIAAGVNVFTVGSLTVNNTGKIEIDRNSGSAAYRLDVTGTTTINPIAGARLRLDSNDDDGTLNLNGAITIDNDGAGVEIGSEDQRAFININAGIVDGGQNDVLTFNVHNTVSGNSDFGTVTVANVASARTAPTFVTGGGILRLNIDNAVGTGKITVQNASALHLGAAQTSLNIEIGEFSALGGDLTGATYGANVIVPAENAVFAGASVLPTSGRVHYFGVTSGSAAIDLSNPSNSIFKAVAFGAYTPHTQDFGATVTEHTAGVGIEVLMQTGKRFGGNSNATATFVTADANEVVFLGVGSLELNEPDQTGTTRAINLDVIKRQGTVLTQNSTIVRISDANALGDGQALNVTDGRVDLDNTGGLQSAAAVMNINSGATLSLDQSVTRGTFNINTGGAIAITSAAQITSGGAFNYADGTLFILDGDFSTTAAFPTNVDYVLHDVDADDFDGVGIVLGQGRRLTTSGTQSGDLTGGAGLSAAPGVTNIILSAANGDTLDINDATNLAGVDIQVNDTASFTTIVSGGTGSTNFARSLEIQNGTVALNTTASKSIDVQAGVLRFEQGAVAGLKDGSITTAVAGVGGFTRIREQGAVEIEYNQETAPEGIFIDEVFIVEGSAPNTAGRNFILDRNGTVTGGNNIITLNNVRMVDGSFVGVDVQDTSNLQGRLSLRLMGSATTHQQTPTSSAHDDFSLNDVTGINPDGTPNNIAPRTLNVGVTPAGTTPGTTGAPNGTGFVMINNVFGTIASNITVNVINGQVQFENGSVLNGTVNANTRTGDFFLRVNAGQDGTVAARLTGTGVINMGHDTGTTVEDIAGIVNEVDSTVTSTPLYNRTDVRVNVLNRTGVGGGNVAILRAERGVDITNTAIDLPGTFEFGEVHVEAGAVASLQSGNEQRVIANFILDNDAIVEFGTASSTNAFIRDVTDPGSPNSLIIRGGNAIRAIGTIAADKVVIGGPLANNAGTLILQPHDATFELTTFPKLGGPASSAVLNLIQGIEVGQGGNLDVGDAGGNNGSLSIAAGLSLGGNGDVDIYVPMTIPAGKRLTGSSSTAIAITLAGSLTIGTDGIAAPGASAGTITIAGNLAFATDAVYEYEIGATPATSDLISLTGTDRTVSFGSTLDLYLTNPGGADVDGQTYVLIDYTGADPAGLPTINFTGPLSGDVAIDSANSQIVLTNVVPEPTSLALAAMAGAGLLTRRRRR